MDEPKVIPPSAGCATDVMWLPSHPNYGSLSMLRYWKLMRQEVRPDDPIRCCTDFPFEPPEMLPRSGRLRRGWTRHVEYPRLVRKHFTGKLAHVLEHGWGDLLKALPEGIPSVVTVHDLIPLRAPRELSTRQVNRVRQWVGHLARANRLLADSAFTRSEIVELLGIPFDRIDVVHLGVSLPARLPSAVGDRAAVGLSEHTWVVGSVGSTLARKNLGVLPDALGRFAQASGRQITLLRVGQPLDEALKARFAALEPEVQLVEWGLVNDDRLELFYGVLDAVVVPSFWEGFGLPVLEGMARGVPVIASDTSSLPEAGGEAALYFDPHEPEAVAARLLELTDPAISRPLVAAGRERAAEFTWRRTLEATYAVYEKVLQTG